MSVSSGDWRKENNFKYLVTQSDPWCSVFWGQMLPNVMSFSSARVTSVKLLSPAGAGLEGGGSSSLQNLLFHTLVMKLTLYLFSLNKLIFR